MISHIKDIIQLLNIEQYVAVYYPTNPEADSFSCKLYTNEQKNDWANGIIDKNSNEYVTSCLGIYLFDAMLDKIVEREKIRTPRIFDINLSKLHKHYEFDESRTNLVYCVYGVLHEVGHWKHFKASEYKVYDYVMKYFIPLIELKSYRDQMEIYKQNAKSLCEINLANEKLLEIDKKYKELEIEIEADKYAYDHLESSLNIISSV